ncbi:MAG: plasmid mobilization protein [Terriglobia bacterium]
MATPDSKPLSPIPPAVPAARSSENYRAHSIGTRLSEAELSEVEAAAAKAGKKVGEWLREAALAQARRTRAGNRPNSAGRTDGDTRPHP